MAQRVSHPGTRRYNKTKCHAPETIWLSNVPAGTTAQGWKMDKLGSWIDPLEANLAAGSGNGGGLTENGAACNPEGTTCGTHLHAVNTGVGYTGENARTMMMSPVDSALVSIGSATPVPTPLTQPDPRGGVHFALVGNIWNTKCVACAPSEPSGAQPYARGRLCAIDVSCLAGNCAEPCVRVSTVYRWALRRH